MKENPKLVIVIPTKNRSTLLGRALESIWSQKYIPYRVVVVNDGSSDETYEYLTSIHDSRLKVIHHETSRGVNAARNTALRTLHEGEWAVPLDDDDLFLPEAFVKIGQAIHEAPEAVQVICFNTIIHKPTGNEVGGLQFASGERFYEPSYEEIMTGVARQRGDNRPVLKWTVFKKHYFSEDINGFEHEFWMLLARDGIRIRCVPQQTILIDLAHDGEHLSSVAARRDPTAFARAHARILTDHVVYFNEHSHEARERAFHALKIAIRAKDPRLAFFFLWYYVRAIV